MADWLDDISWNISEFFMRPAVSDFMTGALLFAGSVVIILVLVFYTYFIKFHRRLRDTVLCWYLILVAALSLARYLAVSIGYTEWDTTVFEWIASMF